MKPAYALQIGRLMSACTRSGQPSAWRGAGRHGRAWRSGGIEGLEGRALLSASPLDPFFNGAHPIVNPATVTTGAATSLNSGSAIAVQPDGRIVVVGAINLRYDVAGFPELAVRRYNPNGTLDTTFGTAGEADITLPTGTGYDTLFPASKVLIQPNGGIVVAVEQAANISQPTSPVVSYLNIDTVVARLTAAGAVDSSFGVSGQTVISTDKVAINQLALQDDGKLVLAGLTAASGMTPPEIAVTRLNTDGSVDTGFNSGNLLLFDAGQAGAGSQSLAPGGLLITPAAKIVVAWTINTTPVSPTTNTFTYNVAELNADGTPNTAFGTGGLSQGTGTPSTTVTAAALQTDGKIVLAGSSLIRLNADGSVDTGFAAPSLAFAPSSLLIQPDGKFVMGSRSSLSVARYDTNGQTDGTFGPRGRASFAVAAPTTITYGGTISGIAGVALSQTNQVVAVGTQSYFTAGTGLNLASSLDGSQLVLTQFKAAVPILGDYSNQGKANIAAQLSLLGQFAIRSATGDALIAFGQKGIGATIPTPGDYDGDGITDIAAYLPALGTLAYRPSSGGPDVLVPFGPKGVGASIPAPGDYDGDGKTDVAVYIPAQGNFAIRPSSGVANYLVPFGTSGVGKSIPAPGDYDGDGKTDPAVYLTGTGTLAYRSSAGTGDVLTQFGPAGVGTSIPAPGDYDGDGKTDVAVYIPAQGNFAIHPSSSVANYLAPFGARGLGGSTPAPGDYDGDGVTDLAVYIPATGLYAYRSSLGLGDVVQGFGARGAGQTIPALSLPPIAVGGQASTSPGAGGGSPAVLIPLTDDLISTPTARKKAVVHLG